MSNTSAGQAIIAIASIIGSACSAILLYKVMKYERTNSKTTESPRHRPRQPRGTQ